MSFLQPVSAAIELGVNIDHIATVRNARGTRYPDPIEAALLAEHAGADVITLHLREDRRHIRDDDVRRLLPLLLTRMNLEAAVTTEMVEFAASLRPTDVCLVPERRAEVTTEGGLDVSNGFDAVANACRILAREGIRVSLFIDPEPTQIDAAVAAGAPVIELHTGRYADASGAAQEHERMRIETAVAYGLARGLKVNAGHGLHYTNVQGIAAIPGIAELNIGHAIVARALFVGWENAIREMKALIIGQSLLGSGRPE